MYYNSIIIYVVVNSYKQLGMIMTFMHVGTLGKNVAHIKNNINRIQLFCIFNILQSLRLCMLAAVCIIMVFYITLGHSIL